jgi:hypothetical protein
MLKQVRQFCHATMVWRYLLHHCAQATSASGHLILEQLSQMAIRLLGMQQVDRGGKCARFTWMTGSSG